MNLSKSFDFFNPDDFTDRIHIIGCGSVGSTVAELLIRFGLKNISLYDFDVVEDRNLVNQMFTGDDLYKPKVECVYNNLIRIVPKEDRESLAESMELFPEGWQGEKLYGYVFLCVDNIELRKKIVTENRFNDAIKAMFDFRTGLTDAQHYAADWSKLDQKKALLNTMDFSHEEAQKAVPMSACRVALCVAPTVRMVCNVGVCNFINFVKTKELKQAMVMDAFSFMLEEI